MALNRRILKAIDEKTEQDPELRSFLKNYLRDYEEGQQAKRIIDKLLNKIDNEN